MQSKNLIVTVLFQCVELVYIPQLAPILKKFNQSENENGF